MNACKKEYGIDETIMSFGIQLGIPAEALAIVLACDALFDFICTGFDQFLIPFGILPQASRLGLVNKEILKSK